MILLFQNVDNGMVSDEEEDEIPLKRRKHKKRAVEPAPKKNKKSKGQQPAEVAKKPIVPSISQFFGRRRCAAEANEKIAR